MGKHKAVWLYVDYPTRHCTFDMFVHCEIDRSMKSRTATSGNFLAGTTRISGRHALPIR